MPLRRSGTGAIPDACECMSIDQIGNGAPLCCGTASTWTPIRGRASVLFLRDAPASAPRPPTRPRGAGGGGGEERSTLPRMEASRPKLQNSAHQTPGGEQEGQSAPLSAGAARDG
eukprot:scaffold176804_cov35-Tisochrysis_lutea.AAC.1